MLGLFGLVFPYVVAAAVSLPTPAPTLPPEIGAVYTRSGCVSGNRALMTALPALIRNDHAISAGHREIQRLDSSEEAQTRMTIMHSRNYSQTIFTSQKSLRDQIMKLHVAAAASTNAQESQNLGQLADSLDNVLSQQTALADQLNGFADTADMALLYRGSDAEQAMNAATGPSDSVSMTFLQQYKQKHPGMADSNIGQLATNVWSDMREMRNQLAQTEDNTTAQVKQFVAFCKAPPKHK